MYPEEWDTDIANVTDRDSQLLVKAASWYGVKLIPVKVKKFMRKGDGEAREGMCFRYPCLQGELNHRHGLW